MVTTTPDRLGDVPPEFGGGFIPMGLVIYLVWGLVKVDLRVEMFSPVVRKWLGPLPQWTTLPGSPVKTRFWDLLPLYKNL